MINRFQSVHALTEQLQTGYCYQMLLYDDMPIGYFGICPQADGSLFLSKLYIKQAFCGKGFASLQFQEILRQARKRRTSSVWLTVNKHNEQAIAVYQHFGMTYIRSQVSEIGNGFVMDDYVFSIPVAQESAIS
ncbi:MAG: GNAT family N-acetyltransferase [Ruminococcus sp.]|nr:GNAT family N-acetyltransferase [Ruminococcus sp.]